MFVLFIIFLLLKQNSCHIEKYKLIEFTLRIFITFLRFIFIFFSNSNIYLSLVIVIYIYIDRRSLVMLLYHLSAKTLTIIIYYIK